MKTWTKPSFREIQMNAEIGSYQPDEGGIDRVTSAPKGGHVAQSLDSPEAASVVVTTRTA